MTRDNQRARVYAAENSVFTWGQTIPNHQLEQWLETTILTKAWFRRRWGNRFIKITLSKGGGYARGNTIALGVQARNEWVFCHELAHCLTPDKHGPAFTAVYLYLIKQVLGKEAATQLRAAFRVHRVKVKASAVPSASRITLEGLAPRPATKPAPLKPTRPTLAVVEREAKKVGAVVEIRRRQDWRGKPVSGEWDLYITPPTGKAWVSEGFDVVDRLEDGRLFTSAYRGSAFTAADRCEEILWVIEQGVA